MKAELNTFIFSGHLIKDAEMGTTSNGIKFCSFVVCNNSTKKNNDGYYLYPNFFNLRVFGNYGEKLCPFMKKGQSVICTCSVEQARWEKDGVKKSQLTLICKDVQLIGHNNNKAPAEETEEIKTEEVPIDKLVESNVNWDSNIENELF